MNRYSNKQKADSTYARPAVHYENQSHSTSGDWLSDHTVDTYDDDALRDWFSATRRHVGTKTMALIVARGLKSMDMAQLPLTTSSRNHSSYSHGHSDGYSTTKSRARSMSVEPTSVRISSKNEKYGGSSQETYAPVSTAPSTFFDRY